MFSNFADWVAFYNLNLLLVLDFLFGYISKIQHKIKGKVLLLVDYGLDYGHSIKRNVQIFY